MAGNLSDYAENKLLNHILGVEAFPMPATVYVALFTSNPTDANTGVEVTGGGYTRKPIPFAKATSTTGTTSNNADVLFPAATASWGTITHIGLYDALTGGNLLWHGPLSASKVISATDEFKIGTGKFIPGLD